jgi:hypothetical protein
VIVPRGLSKQVEIHLSDEHAKTLTRWGAPPLPGAGNPSLEGYGYGLDEAAGAVPRGFYIELRGGSANDAAGNPNVAVGVQCAGRVVIGIWRKDTDAADADDLANVIAVNYDADDMMLRVQYDELMDIQRNINDYANGEHVNVGQYVVPPLPALPFYAPSYFQIKDFEYKNPVTLTVESVDVVTNAEEKGSITQNNETDIVEIRLCFDSHDAVNQLTPPLYLNISNINAAHKISSEGCKTYTSHDPAHANYVRPITLDTDDENPLLVTDADPAHSTWTTRSDYVPGTGVLTLNWDENLDKPNTCVECLEDPLNTFAGNFTLLPGPDAPDPADPRTGFTLTGDNIPVITPGYVPVDFGDKHQVRFHLTGEQMTIVNNWIDLYALINADAVTDTNGNTNDAIAATKIETIGNPPPTIYLPNIDHDVPLVTTAPDAQVLPMTATITDVDPVTGARLYYQVGGGIAKYLPMSVALNAAKSADLKLNVYDASVDIPAVDVNNRGLWYYVTATDAAGGWTDQGRWWDGGIPGWCAAGANIDEGNPRNVTVTDTTVTLDADSYPVFGPGAVPSTYRGVSVPLNTNPVITSTDLFAPFGAPGADWLSWRFDPDSGTYQAGHEAATPIAFGPGVGAWVGTVNPDNPIAATGNTVDVTQKFWIFLERGYNQFGVPCNFSRSWDDTTISVVVPGGPALNINAAATDDPEHNPTGVKWASNVIYWWTGETSEYSYASADPTVPQQTVEDPSQENTFWTGVGVPSNDQCWVNWPGTLDPWGMYYIYAYRDCWLLIDTMPPTKGTLPPGPAPSAKVVSSWSVKFRAESDGSADANKFAGVVTDAVDKVDDRYDVMDLPLLPGSKVRLSFVTEDGTYLQDMKAPADEIIWKLEATSNTQSLVKIKFDASAVPSEYRTALLVDTETQERVDLRSVHSYTYKPSDQVREFKLIISKAHPEVYAAIPDRSILLQNYPNPFNPETWIPFRLSKPSDVTIRIYNIAGELVRDIDLGHQEAGSYTARERAAYWDGKNLYGERVASGMYFYHIQSGSFNATKRMVILK